MASMTESVCYAIKDEVVAMSLPSDATVLAQHLAELDANDLQTLHVVISPRALDAEHASRSATISEVRVGVWIGKKAATAASQWEVVGWAEEIAAALPAASISTAVASYLGSSCSASIMTGAIEFGAEDGIDQRGVYKATIEITAKVIV